MADDIACWRVLAHVVFGRTELGIEDAVAGLHGTTDRLRALPHHLGEVRRLRVVGIVGG